MTPETTTVAGPSPVEGDVGDDRKKIFPTIALAYDFLQPFLTSPGTTVYDLATGQRLPFGNVAAQKAIWSQYTGTVESSFNASLRGLLSGALSWAQAFKSVLADLSIKMSAGGARMTHVGSSAVRRW